VFGKNRKSSPSLEQKLIRSVQVGTGGTSPGRGIVQRIADGLLVDGVLVEVSHLGVLSAAAAAALGEGSTSVM